MSNYEFICKHCKNDASIEFDHDDYMAIHDNYVAGYSNSSMSFNDYTNDQLKIALAIQSLHVECFQDVLEKNKSKVQPGAYVSELTYDDDEGRYVPKFIYVHKLTGTDACEIWFINTSSRYVRKGGEFVSRWTVPIAEAVLYMAFEGETKETIESLRNVLETYVKGERKSFIQEIVGLETESLIDDVFYVQESKSVIENYEEFLSDVAALETSLFSAKVFSA